MNKISKFYIYTVSNIAMPSRTEAQGKRKNVCPDLHAFTYFLMVNPPLNSKALKKLLKSRKEGVLKLIDYLKFKYSTLSTSQTEFIIILLSVLSWKQTC